MSHNKDSWISVVLVAAVAIAIGVLTPGTAYAQGTGAGYCNTSTGCCGWAGKIEGLCCWSYDCGGNDYDSSCDACTLAKGTRSSRVLISTDIQKWLNRPENDDAILLSRLRVRDAEIVRAVRSMR